MAFHDIRFPDNISRGARGGPERRTQIVELANGEEERNSPRANSRRRYDAAYGIRRADDLAAVIAFFEARRGRLYGFRGKDWADHKSCLPSAQRAPADQLIGQGDGTATEFQLLKAYTSGAQSWARVITKPEAGSVVITLGGVAQPAGWSADPLTGIVTFDVPPAAGIAVTAGFEFDVPVRFDTDELPVNRINVAVSRAKGLALVFGAPRLREAKCETVEQMRLVNTICALPFSRSDAG